MGLKISYDCRARMDFDHAQRVVRKLHRFARRLPVDAVSPIRRLDPCDRWHRLRTTHYEEAFEVPALEAVWFAVDTGGAETATFGLAARPETATADGAEVPSGLRGFCTWQDCCKTQYAGLPDEGGDPNFLRAHISLVAILDEASRLGLDVDVYDDGGYWEHRDPEALLDELARWNRLIAGFTGMLIDAFGETHGTPVAPILSHPAFEHLEAEGRAGSGERTGQE